MFTDPFQVPEGGGAVGLERRGWRKADSEVLQALREKVARLDEDRHPQPQDQPQTGSSPWLKILKLPSELCFRRQGGEVVRAPALESGRSTLQSSWSSCDVQPMVRPLGSLEQQRCPGGMFPGKHLAITWSIRALPLGALLLSSAG